MPNVFDNIAKWEKESQLNSGQLAHDKQYAKELIAHASTLSEFLKAKDFDSARTMARLMHQKLNEIEDEIESGKAQKE